MTFKEGDRVIITGEGEIQAPYEGYTGEITEIQSSVEEFPIRIDLDDEDDYHWYVEDEIDEIFCSNHNVSYVYYDKLDDWRCPFCNHD